MGGSVQPDPGGPRSAFVSEFEIDGGWRIGEVRFSSFFPLRFST